MYLISEQERTYTHYESMENAYLSICCHGHFLLFKFCRFSDNNQAKKRQVLRYGDLQAAVRSVLPSFQHHKRQ